MSIPSTAVLPLATVIVGVDTHKHVHVAVAIDGGITVTDAQLATVRLERHRFHGDWNYTIHPAAPRTQKSVIV